MFRCDPIFNSPVQIVKFRIFSEFLAALASLDLTSNCIDQEIQDRQRIRSFAIWMFPESYSTLQCLFDFGVSGKDERRRFTLITVAFLFPRHLRQLCGNRSALLSTNSRSRRD